MNLCTYSPTTSSLLTVTWWHLSFIAVIWNSQTTLSICPFVNHLSLHHSTFHENYIRLPCPRLSVWHALSIRQICVEQMNPEVNIVSSSSRSPRGCIGFASFCVPLEITPSKWCVGVSSRLSQKVTSDPMKWLRLANSGSFWKESCKMSVLGSQECEVAAACDSGKAGRPY